MDRDGVRGCGAVAEMMNHPELDMAFLTPSNVLVHVLRKYGEARKFCPADPIKSIFINQTCYLDCIQSLATGKRETCEHYEQNKAMIACHLKHEVTDSFHPRFVVAPPSRRPVAGDLARLLAIAYKCTDISELFAKKILC